MKDYIIVITLGYAIGSIPFSFLLCKLVGKIDIREHGSGNTGATNVYRVLGAKVGIIAFLGDFLKGYGAAMIGKSLFGLGMDGAILAATASVIGHCYPFLLGFKGGKGVATTAGMIFGLNPYMLAILLTVQFATLAITKYMSLSSVLSAITFPLLAMMFGMSTLFTSISILLGAFVVYRHRSNIRKLIKGEENKFHLKGKKGK